MYEFDPLSASEPEAVFERDGLILYRIRLDNGDTLYETIIPYNMESYPTVALELAKYLPRRAIPMPDIDCPEDGLFVRRMLQKYERLVKTA